MYLKHLEIHKFRNLKSFAGNFAPELNFFFGDNAQGKSNLIEAIYLLCLAKSYRTNEDAELAPFGDSTFHLEGIFSDREGLRNRVIIRYDAVAGKSIKIDGKKVIAYSKVVGKFPIIVLSNDDYQITSGPPAQRRRYFNILLSQSSARYLDDLKEYEKILKQRNRVLQENNQGKRLQEYSAGRGGTSANNLLEIWDQQLIRVGAEIMQIRQKTIEEINALVAPLYQQISDSAVQFRIEYRPCVPVKPGIELQQSFASSLQNMRFKEQRFGMSLVGPHRDEFVFLVAEHDLRKYGSQGEHKSTLVSLKAAEARFLLNKTGTEPILLLDDLNAELDKHRSKNVLKLFQDHHQVFVTGTSLDHEAFKKHYAYSFKPTSFWIQDGEISPLAFNDPVGN